MFGLILIALLCIISTALVHEYFHVRALRKLGRKAQIIWGVKGLEVEADYTGLKGRELYDVYADGVFVGLAPIIICAMFIHPAFLLYMIPYLIMSKSDIKNMIQARKSE